MNRRRFLSSSLGAAVATQAVAAPVKATTAYYYDKDRSSLTFTDIKFPSDRRGVATGILTEKDRPKPVALVTSDAGANWSIVETKDAGISLFFLNETIGWMVATQGIYETREAGRSWTKIKSPRGITRVWFADENTGWAIGVLKSVYSTTDGGKSWKKVPAAEQPPGDAKYTAYSDMSMLGKFGLIGGTSVPPRRVSTDLRGLPEWMQWMDPESQAKAREWPHLNIILETKDGGVTWMHSEASIFGIIRRIAIQPRQSLLLLEFRNNFRAPSALLVSRFGSGETPAVFSDKNIKVTDFIPWGESGAIIAGFETPGELATTPIPGKLIVRRSADLKLWEPITVDYRAVANDVSITSTPSGQVWVATDTGMLLKF